VLPRDRERNRERVEDLRLFLDDHLGWPLKHRVGVDRDDQERNQQHPAQGLEECQEPPAGRRDAGELDEVRRDVEPGELEEDREDDERDDSAAEGRSRRSAPEGEGEPRQREERRNEHEAHEGNVPPEAEIDEGL
jgi:hypothetical protein